MDPLSRPAARVVLLDTNDRILLFRCVAPGRSDSFWITPGGGVEEGEEDFHAASRELFEETGLRVPLGPCVWTRRHVHRWGDTLQEAVERFFVAAVRVPPTEISTEGWTESESEWMREPRWWSLQEIRSSDQVFAPRRLAEFLPALIARQWPSSPIPVGV